MKKLLILGLSASLLLAGCTSIQRVLRGDEYVDSSLAASASSAEASKKEAETKEALTNKNANFPQLSTKVAKDEAKVKIVTTAGDITLKLFPKYAPLAVENFLTHAKEGYYDGVIFHRVIKGFMIQSGDPKGNGTGGESIWYGKNKQIDSERALRMKLLPIYTTSAGLYLWPMQRPIILMVVNSLLTKTRQTAQANYLKANIQNKLLKLIRKVEIHL